jgi:hypothetical protein
VKKSSLTLFGERFAGKVLGTPAKHSFSAWERAMFDIEAIRQHKAIVVTDLSRSLKVKPQVKGLAEKFARLKNSNDINSFAAEYGLLGVCTLPESILDAPAYGGSWYEPLSVWVHYIEVIRRAYFLYAALRQRKRGFDSEIEGKLLAFRDTGKKQDIEVCWFDGRATGVKIANFRLTPQGEEAAAASVLGYTISKGLKGGVDLWFSAVAPSNATPLGFLIKDVRCTEYLLAAIYYDLWESITTNQPFSTCNYCGLPLKKRGRREFCNNACRQAAYRERKKIKKGGNK